jgi:hypothetical protein
MQTRQPHVVAVVTADDKSAGGSGLPQMMQSFGPSLMSMPDHQRRAFLAVFNSA